MLTSPQIRFRGMEASDAVRTVIEKKISKLEQCCGRINSCRVTVEEPHRRHRKGKLFSVRIDMTMPGREIVVDRTHGSGNSHEDVYVAIRDAFDAARQKVEHYAMQSRGHVKFHETPSHGRVARVLTGEDCGFIETPDGREVYFHRNSLLEGDFDRLEQGAEVRFTEEQGVEGPQASTVRLAGKHHLAG